MRAFLILSIAALLITVTGCASTPAAISGASPCGQTTSITELKERAITAGLPGLSIIQLEDHIRIRFMSAFNSLPPVSDLNPKEVYLFASPVYPTVMVALVTAGCVKSIEQLPSQVFLEMAGLAKTEPSGLKS